MGTKNMEDFIAKSTKTNAKPAKSPKIAPKK
jgi:hypothetical protein